MFTQSHVKGIRETNNCIRKGSLPFILKIINIYKKIIRFK